MSAVREVLLSLRGLSVSYSVAGRERAALEQVDLELARGETLAVVGESGSGKSTLAFAILGLLSPAARTKGGELVLEGRAFDAAKPALWTELRGKSLGFVPQDIQAAFDPLLCVADQVAEPLVARGMPRECARARAEELLHEVGLAAATEVGKSLPGRLSGGQRQRAAIAAALALDPKILIADEPTSALDPVNARALIDLLDRLRRSRGLGLLWISHDLRAVEARADRIVVLCAGRVVESGAAREVLRAPRHAHTRALVNSLVRPARARDLGAPSAPGTSVLRVRDLEARPRRRGSFERERERPFALEKLQFELRSGEITALIGQSGSGKSTVLRALLGLEPSARGNVTLSGAASSGELLGGDPAQLARARRGIGWIPQDPGAALDPRATLLESICEPLLAGGDRALADARSKAVQLLEDCGLKPEFAARLPHQLSGGERQRASLARALAQDPRVLLLDEPTSSLDTTVAARIVELVVGLVAAKGLCALWVTHDVDLARHVAQQVLVIEDGRLVEAGPAEQVLSAPESNAARALTLAAAHTLIA